MNETYPEVIVEDITKKSVQEVMLMYPSEGVNLGDAKIESKLNSIIERTRQNGGRRFILTWIGNKIPRGAKVLGRKITWTQNGLVEVDPGGAIGTYDRLIEWGGNSKKRHVMIIYAYPNIPDLGAEEPTEPEMVELKNSSKEARPIVETTMFSLHQLLDTGMAIPFYELVMMCRDPKHQPFGNTSETLTELGLMKNGTVHDSIKNIVLSAVTGNDLDMTLDSPLK